MKHFLRSFTVSWRPVHLPQPQPIFGHFALRVYVLNCLALQLPYVVLCKVLLWLRQRLARRLLRQQPGQEQKNAAPVGAAADEEKVADEEPDDDDDDDEEEEEQSDGEEHHPPHPRQPRPRGAPDVASPARAAPPRAAAAVVNMTRAAATTIAAAPPPSTRLASSTHSTTRFAILTAARSGSTLLVDLLRRTDGVRCHGECLNAAVETYGDVSAAWSARRDLHLEFWTSPSLCEAVGLAHLPRAAGVKVFLEHLENHAMDVQDLRAALQGTTFLTAASPAVRRQTKLVLLYRQDLLAAYSSLVLAHQLNQWVALDDDGGDWDNNAVTVDLDFAAGGAAGDTECISASECLVEAAPVAPVLAVTTEAASAATACGAERVGPGPSAPVSTCQVEVDVEDMLDYAVDLRRLWSQVLSSLALAGSVEGRDVLFITFEQLASNQDVALRRVIDFLCEGGGAPTPPLRRTQTRLRRQNNANLDRRISNLDAVRQQLRHRGCEDLLRLDLRLPNPVDVVSTPTLPHTTG